MTRIRRISVLMMFIVTIGILCLATVTQAQSSPKMSKDDFNSFVLVGATRFNASRSGNPNGYYNALITLREIVKNNPSLTQGQSIAIWNVLDSGIHDATVSDFGSYLLGVGRAAPQLAKLGIKMPLFDKLAKLTEKVDAVTEIGKQLLGEPHLSSDEELARKAGDSLYELIALAKRQNSSPLIGMAVNHYIQAINGKGSFTDDATQTALNSPEYAPIINSLGLLALRNSDGSATISQNVIDALTKKFGKSFQDIRSIMAAILTDVQAGNENWQDVAKWINSINDRQMQAAVNAAKAAAYQQQLAVEKTSVYLLSTFIGFGNPRLGQEIGTIGNAAIKAADAVKTILNVGLLSAGGFIATGSLVEAAMDIFNLFGGGQSVDSIILDQIQAIREDIRNLGLMVQERFDHVDMELNQIFMTLEENFAQINFRLGTIGKTLSDIQISLLNVQERLNRLETDVYDFLNSGFRMDFLTALNGALHFQERTGIPMPYYPDYINNENLLNAWVTLFGKDSLRAGPYQRSFAPADIRNELSVFPLLTNVNYIAQAPYELFGMAPLATDRVDNPGDFVTAANAYRTLAEENPQDAWRIDIGRFYEVYNEGLMLRDALKNITQVGGKANKPLFKALTDYYRSKVGAVSDKIYQDILLNFKRTHNPVIPDDVDLWGEPDQVVYDRPQNLGRKLQLWSGEPADNITPPSNLADALPKPLRLAEALGLGTLDFYYQFEPYDWTGQRVSEGHNQARLRGHVIVTWNGTEVARWSANCTFTLANVEFHNKDGKWIGTTFSQFYFDFGSHLQVQASHWWTGSPIEWWWLHHYGWVLDSSGNGQWRDLWISLPALRSTIINPANLSVNTTILNSLRDQVAQKLHDAQVDFYNEVISNLSGDTPLRGLATQLSGAQLLLADFVALGMPRSLAGNDLLRASLYGDQQLMDTDSIKALYNAALAALNNSYSVPKVDFVPVATDRCDALSLLLTQILDSIDQGTFSESMPLLEDALTRLELYQATKYIPTVADYTRQVRVIRSPMILDPIRGNYVQWLVVTNIGSKVIDGPISLVFDFSRIGGKPVAALKIPDGETSYFRPAHSPYVNVPISINNVLAPFVPSRIRVEFTPIAGRAINYTTRVIGGYGRR